MKKVCIIGAGFSSLTAACTLAGKFDVTVIDKNEMVGGRCQMFKSNGFTFDMGPSWYWMPDVFEDFFNQFGKSVSDYYQLKRLDPSYQVVFENQELVKIPASIEDLFELFESIEIGSADKLKKFLSEAQYKYETGMSEFVWKPSHSITEFFDLRILKSSLKLQMFSSLSKQVRSLFKDPKLIQILEFPVLFLGATPQKTPALYSLMNYADLKLGTWYPMGGMHEIPKAIATLAKELGVKFRLGEAVQKLEVKDGNIRSVKTDKCEEEFDVVISGADYHYTDRHLLDEENSNYSEKYWDSRVMAPSSLLFYVGVSKKLNGLKHHNLFFDEDFKTHAHQIYTDKKWPDKPLFYVCCPSKTDPSVAPEGMENLFILIPVAADLKDDSDELYEDYFNMVCDRIVKQFGGEFRDAIVFKRVFSVKDFKESYNSFKGNAYGLANTLMQTAFLKPKLKSKKIANLYYTGQLTTPGPGVPPSIISGQVVAKEIIKYYI